MRSPYGGWVQIDSAIARYEMWELGERIVQRAGVLSGEDVLDVACGTGSAAIRAAQSGARVVGLDLTPPLFDAARREAAQARTDVRWVSGDAAALPFSDGSFDVVVSVFGAALAPRQRATARELARVLRRGGRLAMFNWTARGGPGELCGGLNIGGGGSVIPEGPTPDGSISRFALECTGSILHDPADRVLAQPADQHARTRLHRRRVQLRHAAADPKSPRRRFPDRLRAEHLGPAGERIARSPTGASSTSVPLQSDNYLTGNLAQLPCPRCSATGTPAAPGTGTCDRGPRTGMPCTTTNSGGITRDCPTGGADAGHVCTPAAAAPASTAHTLARSA